MFRQPLQNWLELLHRKTAEAGDEDDDDEDDDEKRMIKKSLLRKNAGKEIMLGHGSIYCVTFEKLFGKNFMNV